MIIPLLRMLWHSKRAQGAVPMWIVAVVIIILVTLAFILAFFSSSTGAISTTFNELVQDTTNP